LENFEIAFPLTTFDGVSYNGTSLIPSLLPDEEPKVIIIYYKMLYKFVFQKLQFLWPSKARAGYGQLSRLYKFDFIPYGFFGRLIGQLSPLLNCKSTVYFLLVRILQLQNKSDKAIYWQHGILINNSDNNGGQILVELFPNKKMISITVRYRRKKFIYFLMEIFQKGTGTHSKYSKKYHRNIGDIGQPLVQDYDSSICGMHPLRGK
jgi:hypothetical protein